MVRACDKSAGCCAPGRAGNHFSDLLIDLGYLRAGVRGVIYGNPRRWTLGDVICTVGSNGQLVVKYRVYSLSESGLIELVVPPEMFIPDDDAAPVGARTPPTPSGSDLLAAATKAARQAFEQAGYRVETSEVPVSVATGADGPVDKAAPACAQAKPTPAAAAQEGNVKTEPAGCSIEWLPLSQTRPGLLKSVDGRFTLAIENPITRPMFAAADMWTGESVRQLATRPAAEQWCRTRTNAPPLEWEEYGAAHVARSECGVKFSITAAPGVFLAVDARLAGGTGLRNSPLFSDLELAKKWCEARACCVVEAGPPGGTATLRFQDPVPF